MRIRVPPQLIVFALGLAVAMAIPGLPRRHDGPPSIAAGLTFSTDDGAPGWGERLDTHFPEGSSAETLVSELRRQGFELEQRNEFLSDGLITLASYSWPRNDECHWILGVEARSDRAGALRDTAGEVRISCGDTGMVWMETPGRMALPPPPSPFEGG